MKANLLATTLAALCLTGLGTTASAGIIIDYVPVGNAGNAADPLTGYGSVGYSYGIGKYEVTLTQYTAFLNAVAASDPNGLYNPDMGTNLNIAGIARSGSDGGYTYTVVGDGQRPVTYVSFLDAMRFANWVNNGQGGAGTTETGAYTLSLGGLAPRNDGATVWIPTENEWYKAAYYDPTPGAGGGSNYWLYATQGDTQPNSRNGSVSDPNSANYYYNDGIANGYNDGYAVTQSGTYVSTLNYLTAVGVFTQADSYYGTFDQSGNVWEWNEAIISVSDRGFRGGSWGNISIQMQSSFRFGSDNPSGEHSAVGFRLATVPEPTGVVTGLLCVLAAASRRRRQRA